MTNKQFEKAKNPKNIIKLLDDVKDKLSTDYQRTSYNFLIDYTEHPQWFESHEGGRLLLLCLEVLVNLNKT